MGKTTENIGVYTNVVLFPFQNGLTVIVAGDREVVDILSVMALQVYPRVPKGDSAEPHVVFDNNSFTLKVKTERCHVYSKKDQF